MFVVSGRTKITRLFIKSPDMQQETWITRRLTLLRRGWMLAGLCLALSPFAHGQESPAPSGLPVSVSLFSHSISLPNFRGFFKEPNWGVRIGTEWAYRKKDGSHWLQTLHLGYYHHDGFQQGVFAGTEFGYRKRLGAFAADLTLGANYLHLVSELRRYEPVSDGFQPASQRMHKLMPSLGLAMSYRTGVSTDLFLRYEAFGEIPFSYKGVPVLPHKALHLGARFHPF